ncbi:hypothetical protein VTO73DRAFT_2840 [Trametes versicolor]
MRNTCASASVSSPKIPEAAHVFPGMEFLTARGTILKTKLFRCVAEMHKDALLHSHLDATVNARVLLNIALKHLAIHVRTSTQFTAQTIYYTVLPEFGPLPDASSRERVWDGFSRRDFSHPPLDCDPSGPCVTIVVGPASASPERLCH